MPEAIVAAGGRDLFRCFVLPTGLTEDKYVVAVEVRPGNTRVVHHSPSVDRRQGPRPEIASRQKKARADAADRGPGYSVAMGVGFLPTDPTIGGLGGWAPGSGAGPLPDGVGYRLPKGSDIVIQIHYHRNGRAEKDRTRIGLYFAKKPVKE